MLKTLILQARNGGYSLKKRRFLKLIHLVVYIKTFYLSDNQCFLCNAKNKRFSSSKDNVPANIGYMCGQNSLFVKFIRVSRRGVVYHVPQYPRNKQFAKWTLRTRRNVINPKRSIDRGVVLLSKNKSFPTAFARLCGILPALLHCRSPLRPR